ncbi:MAG: phytoene/squalene synthase family protein [Methylovulum sp.]|jgi:farnesyl-diphosphate farnesyltransferase|nr:phytoene/squalene synthase family protein [Methylovulum sp.]MCF7999209.1 phytoene/squalene synthase family protein [Methylovulum sp.]
MSTSRISLDNPKALNQLSDDDFQAALLEGVSRTFALTIPQLPEKLFGAVANAYLLCRIVDTIEDEVSLSARQKLYFCEEFIQVVKSGDNAEPFAVELAPLLSAQTLAAEHTLIHVLPRVVQITHSFDPEQINALSACVETMAEGMPVFQAQNLQLGLATLADMNRYCYYVAGCVGEMLTKLFSHYSSEIATNQKTMEELSISFGQGLQMTNILKDIWDDAQRGVCWLPQDIFSETGFDLSQLTQQGHSEEFRQGMTHLISIAHQHLANALQYTLLIPAHETGIRKFCLWALGMAVLTLQKIRQSLRHKQVGRVKISRNQVKLTILATNTFVSNDKILKLLFNLSSRGLARSDWTYNPVNRYIVPDITPSSLADASPYEDDKAQPKQSGMQSSKANLDF